jgi:uncharacterized membrane protein YedE/YeeE
MWWADVRPVLLAFVAGILFGLGLTISRMIDPAKVLGFLDVTGNWDPSLALVMAGALAVMAIAYRIAGSRDRPLLAGAFRIPTRGDIDTRLVSGALIFGVGWGLVGFCPGPAISGLALGRYEVYLFVVAMLAGMALQRYGPWRVSTVGEGNANTGSTV